eukprot:Skav219821  [mRNA]  locus=scaffold147:423453:433802:+ [translate_table: standard]
MATVLMIMTMPMLGDADEAMIIQRHSKAFNALGLELSDGKLDFLSEDDAPYTAEEVGYIAANMASNMFRNGTVVAAPAKVSSNHSNDYYFMWQRDAAMSMRSLLRLIVDAPGDVFESQGNRTSAIRKQFVSYTQLLPRLWKQSFSNTFCPPWYQMERPGCAPMGEPKYFVNGSVYNKAWGRPQSHGMPCVQVLPQRQNDGPAIAATFLGEFLNAILDVEDRIPGRTWQDFKALRRRHHIQNYGQGWVASRMHMRNAWYNDGSVGPWEEVYGRHFFVSEAGHGLDLPSIPSLWYLVAHAWCEDKLTIKDARALAEIWQQLSHGTAEYLGNRSLAPSRHQLALRTSHEGSASMDE